MASTVAALCALFVGIIVSYIMKNRYKRRGLLPPGPKSWPIVGNLFHMPTSKPWLAYRDWAHKYGSDLLYVYLPRQPTVILNSYSAASDLLETKTFSDRPDVIMDVLTGWDWNVASMSYGPRWRDRRRLLHRYFNQAAVKDYETICTREVRTFLRCAVSFTEGIDVDSVSRAFGTIVLEIAYGITEVSLVNELVYLSRKAAEAFLLNRMGASARSHGNAYRPIVQAARTKGHDIVIDAMIQGTATASMTQQLVQDLRDADLNLAEYTQREEVVKDATGIVYTAAVDIETAVAMSFILAMGMHPIVQQRAQKELDLVVGTERLPTSADMDSLPYVQAVFLEVLRWFPVDPLGVPRHTTDDCEYQGYLIPGGTTIIANIWSILHNPADYPEPESFNPGRFLRGGVLNPDVRNSADIIFGFGRRVCPGKYMAQNTLLLLIASTLHVYNIEPLTADPIVPEPTTGLASFPGSVPCRFTVRNENAMALIEASS